NHIVDLVRAVIVDQSPVNSEGRGAAGADNVGGDDDPIAVASAASDIEDSAAKITEPSRIDVCDITLEERYELPLLLLARASPIAAEDKPGDTGAVEILVEELSEPGASYRGIGFSVAQFGRPIPQVVHNGE